MSAIYRQGPQQPWRNHVLRHGTLARTTALVVPPVYEHPRRTIFRARPKAHHGNQLAAAVVIPRPRENTMTVPQRHNYQPIPQGSSGITGNEPGYYGEGYYGEGYYGE